MKVFTCLKETPSRDTRYELSPDSSWIGNAEVTHEISECDEYALEEALKLKEQHQGEVVLLTAGRAESEKSMRKGLAMGADRGVLILDRERELSSPYRVAAALEKVLQDQEYDLILTGTQSDDYGYAQTGPMLAQLLGLPHATIVMQIQVQEDRGSVRALREMESGWFEWVEIPLPAVLTIQAGISQIRYATLRGIMQARRKEIRKIELGGLGLDLSSMPHLEIERLYFPEQTSKAEMIEGTPDEIASTLVDRLRREAKVL